MRGLVLIDDDTRAHVIPRSDVRYVEIATLAGYTGGFALHYQLAGMPTRSIEWKSDCRPPSLKTKIEIGKYNELAAHGLKTMITRGHRDLHLERRSDGVILVRSGLIEDDERSVLCRKFIEETALAAIASPHGRLDETHGQLLEQIRLAARDLRLPDEYPIREEAR